MVTYKLKGQCHCGNIVFNAGLTRSPATYSPRSCDCDFCSKHGASYVSEPQGSLSICVNDVRYLGKYRQGNGLADCILCRNCGVLIAIAFQSSGQLYATINTKVINGDVHFGEEVRVSPKRLSDSEKIERWKEIWFANVTITSSHG